MHFFSPMDYDARVFFAIFNASISLSLLGYLNESWYIAVAATKACWYQLQNRFCEYHAKDSKSFDDFNGQIFTKIHKMERKQTHVSKRNPCSLPLFSDASYGFCYVS